MAWATASVAVKVLIAGNALAKAKDTHPRTIVLCNGNGDSDCMEARRRPVLRPIQASMGTFHECRGYCNRWIMHPMQLIVCILDFRIFPFRRCRHDSKRAAAEQATMPCLTEPSPKPHHDLLPITAAIVF